MDFKVLVLIVCMSCLQMACTGYQPLDGENVIGRKVENITSLVTSTHGEHKTVAIFDETIKAIHQFDLETMKHNRFLTPKHPDEKHGLLYDSQGQYVVDITKKNITIFDSEDKANHNPIKMVGEPQSAAFRPDLGILLVVDKLRTLGFLKLSPQGKVLDSWVKGSSFPGTNGEVLAGDINSRGELVVSLNNGSFAVIDISASMTQKKWVMRTFSVGLSNVSWLAPVESTQSVGVPKGEFVLVLANNNIALLDIDNESIVDSYSYSSNGLRPVKLSKSTDPHILSYDSQKNVHVHYVDNKKIVKKMKVIPQRWLYHSQLEIEKNLWLVVAKDLSEEDNEFHRNDRDSYFFNYNDLNYKKTDRLLRQYRLDDMLALTEFKVPDNAKVRLAQSYVFCLFPSKLGYATTIDVNDEAKRELKLFNLQYIKK